MSKTAPHKRSYADILRDCIFTARSEECKSVRQIGRELNYSYEHVRKVLRGDPVASKEFNDRLSEYLGLDKEEMWQLAQREKAERKFGSQVVDRIRSTTDEMTAAVALLDSTAKRLLGTIIELWPQLSAEDQRRVTDVAKIWSDSKRQPRARR